MDIKYSICLHSLSHYRIISHYYRSIVYAKRAYGASNSFVKVLGDRGAHTRGIYGIDNLARNFSIAITSSFTLKA